MQPLIWGAENTASHGCHGLGVIDMAVSFLSSTRYKTEDTATSKTSTPWHPRIRRQLTDAPICRLVLLGRSAFVEGIEKLFLARMVLEIKQLLDAFHKGGTSK